MSDSASVEPPASPPGPSAAPPAESPAAPSASSPDQDGWLHKALGIDLSTYAPPAGDAEPSGGGFFGKIGKAVSGVVDDVGKVVGKVADTVGDAVETVAETVTDAVETVAETVSDGIGAVVDGVKNIFRGPPPVPRAELGPAQTGRATKLLDKMPPEDKAKVQAMLDEAKPDEKKYLQKALASAHSAAELDDFYKEIKGKDAAWMEKNLHVVGDSDGKGIKQQWHDSCGPTTVQAMKAELDPVYALKLRKDNKDLTKADDSDATALNPEMAEEQRKLLVDHGGTAVNRENETDGKGMTLGPTLNEQKDKTGLKFDTQAVTPDNVDAELGEIDKSINEGLPVPLRVSDAGNTGGHFVMVTGVDPGPPRRYAIHDPWDGKIVTVTDKQIKENDFNIANWNKVSHIYKPSEAPEPAP